MENIITSLTPLQRRTMIVAVALIIVMTILGVVWVVKANYQTIPVDSIQQSAALIEKFEQNNLDYKYTPDGELLVNQEQLGKSQLLLEQSQGSNFLSHGLELFDKTDYGMTEHAQKVTFQRAMQGELERTLSSISYINYARVHLTLANKKLFSTDSLPAKASVTLFTEPGYEMTPHSISGIQSLVAAAVEGLNIDQVTVFSHHGNQLSIGPLADSDDPQLLVGSEAKEAELIKKVEKLLMLHLPQSQFAVSASVELSQTKISSVEKSLLVGPSGEGILIRKKTSNRDLASNNEETVPNTQLINEELEYSVGSKTEQSTKLAGHIEKVGIAVAITANIGEKQIDKLKILLASAVGLVEGRGDTLAIEYFEPVNQGENTSIETLKSSLPLDDLNTRNIQPQPEGNDFVFNNMALPVLLLILVPTSLFLLGLTNIWRRRLPKKERKALLQEVSQWLEVQEARDAR